MHHIYGVNVTNKSLERLFNGDTKCIWTKSTNNEFVRLSQGNKHVVKSTDTIDFIRKQDVP